MSSQTLTQNVIENVIKSLDDLVQATSVKSVIEHSQQISKALHLSDCWGIQKFVKLNSILDVRVVSKWNRVASILKALEKKLNLDVYEHRSKLGSRTVLVIGGGMAGLRVAIELLLIGVKVIVVEKRDEFTRNNVIHLWPNVINDMNSFGAKRFYSQFCVGTINHVSIRQIQLILLKIAIIYGVRFIPNVAFDELCPRLTEPREIECSGTESCNCCCHVHSFGKGAYGHFSSHKNPIAAQELHSVAFDIIINCDGSREAFSRFFPRNELRNRLAIGLTVNFINHRTEEETQCSEISGVSKIYKQQWFKDLKSATGVDLENIVYYRGETHYFVMTASKQSLLARGVLRQDYTLDQSHLLLDNDNIDLKNLMKYSRDVAHYSTKLPYLDFASKASGGPDIQLFDFTSMYSASNASCAKKTYLKCCQPNIKMEPTSSTYCLLMLCGDSLLQPFWPTGSGAGRGFLSAMDAAWLAQMWFTEANPLNVDSMLSVIAKRELVYRLLAQTGPENIVLKNFTLDPMTRYNQLNLRDQKLLFDVKQQVRQLIVDTRDMNAKRYNENKRNRRATVGVDPDELKKAKKWLPEYSNSVYHSEKAPEKYQPSVDVRRNSSFKNITANSNYLKPQEDNVLEYKPRNSPEFQRSSFEQKFVDHCPRNQSIPVSQDKKNYEAKNRVFEFEDFDRYKYDKKPKDSLRIEETSRKTPREVSPVNLNAEYAPKECYSKNLENFPEDGQSLQNYSTSKSKSFGTSRDFYQDFGFDDSEIEAFEAYENNNDRKNVLLYGANQRPKSVPKRQIIERAHNLKQMLDEFHKPMEPNLQRVGRFEEDDWNVKKWTSDDTFKTRLPDRPKLVHENSADLLQSRIEQYKRNNDFRNEMHLQKENRPRTRELVNVRQDEIRQKFDKPSKSEMPLLSVEMVRAQNATGIRDPNYYGLNVQSSPQPSGGYSPRNSTQPGTYGMMQQQQQPAQQTKLIPAPSSVSVHTTPSPTEAMPRNCYRCAESVSTLDGLNIGGNQYHKSCLNCAKCFFMLQPDELVTKNNDFLCKLCRRTKLQTLNSSGMMKMLLGETSGASSISSFHGAPKLSKESPTILPSQSSSSSSKNIANITDSREPFVYPSSSLFSSTRSIEAKKNFLVNLEQIDLRSQEKLNQVEKHPADVVEEIGKSLMSVSITDPTFLGSRKKTSPVSLVTTNAQNSKDDDEENADIDDDQPENDIETDEDFDNKNVQINNGDDDDDDDDDDVDNDDDDDDDDDNDDDYVQTFDDKNVDSIVLEQQILPEPETKPAQQLFSDSDLSQSDPVGGQSSSTNFTDDERSESDTNARQEIANRDTQQTLGNLLNNISNPLSHAEIPLADDDDDDDDDYDNNGHEDNNDNFDDKNVITFDKYTKNYKSLPPNETSLPPEKPNDTKFVPAFQSLPPEMCAQSTDRSSPHFSSLMTQSCVEPIQESAIAQKLTPILKSASVSGASGGEIPPPPTSSPPPLDDEQKSNPKSYSRSNSSSLAASAFAYRHQPTPKTNAISNVPPKPGTISIISPTCNNSNHTSLYRNADEKTHGGVRMINAVYNYPPAITNGHYRNGNELSTNQSRYQGGFTEKLYRTRSQPTLMEQLNSIDQRLKNRLNHVNSTRHHHHHHHNHHHYNHHKNDDEDDDGRSNVSRANSASSNGSKLRTMNCSGQSQSHLVNSSLAKSSAALSVAPTNSLDQV